MTQQSVDLLIVAIDCSLYFEKHVGKLCKSSAFQLSALKRLRPYLTNQRTHKILIQSCTLSHFNYCPLVWCFTTSKQLQKMGKMQGRALRYITDDYVSTYETLLINTGFTTMRVRQMQNFCIEIYKTLGL